MHGKYVSVTSFKRDGTGVATPVWFLEEDGRLLVHTGARSFKVKRIRRNSAVTVAPCGPTGKLRGEPVPAHAEVLPDTEVARVEKLLARKYWLTGWVLTAGRAVRGLFRRGQAPMQNTVLAITLD
jgi:PPOX class probable F420-dependent enzyme